MIKLSKTDKELEDALDQLEKNMHSVLLYRDNAVENIYKTDEFGATLVKKNILGGIDRTISAAQSLNNSASQVRRKVFDLTKAFHKILIEENQTEIDIEEIVMLTKKLSETRPLVEQVVVSQKNRLENYSDSRKELDQKLDEIIKIFPQLKKKVSKQEHDSGKFKLTSQTIKKVTDMLEKEI